MKIRKQIPYIFLAATLLGTTSSCSLNRIPETKFSDASFWNTENDLKGAANRLYQQLGGYALDNRADDMFGQDAAQNEISNGSRSVPNTSDDWSKPYDRIFEANNILEKGGRAQVSDEVKNHYFAEARFFRAYYYFMLLKKYGDVPLLLKTLDVESPELLMPRTDREVVLDSIYADLDFAAKWLPLQSALAQADYGRLTAGAALAFKSRVALYAGTYAKFHDGNGDAAKHLQKAVDAASAVMDENYYGLFPSYEDMFQHAGDGSANKENVFVKIYGSNAIENGTYTNIIVGHDNSRNMENGRFAPTRNLLAEYLCDDGLPWGVSPKTVPETSYNDIFENRDPRLTMTVFKAGEEAYKGPWVPNASAVRTGYACKKGFNLDDWNNIGKATVDKALIRYAEVLLNYAEAKFELDGSISDDDLNKTINLLRDRVNMPVHLTNSFVSANGLDMRTEIRRERTVELALEGFRYDDLIRWKTAETALKKDILGAKYTVSEWIGSEASNFKLTADSILIVEPKEKRSFDPARDYLYPVPLNEISLSNNNVTQNPVW